MAKLRPMFDGDSTRALVGFVLPIGFPHVGGQSARGQFLRIDDSSAGGVLDGHGDFIAESFRGVCSSATMRP